MNRKLYEKPEVRAVEISLEQCLVTESVNSDWQKGWNELEG